MIKNTELWLFNYLAASLSLSPQSRVVSGPMCWTQSTTLQPEPIRSKNEFVSTNEKRVFTWANEISCLRHDPHWSGVVLNDKQQDSCIVHGTGFYWYQPEINQKYYFDWSTWEYWAVIGQYKNTDLWLVNSRILSCDWSILPGWWADCRVEECEATLLQHWNGNLISPPGAQWPPQIHVSDAAASPPQVAVAEAPRPGAWEESVAEPGGGLAHGDHKHRGEEVSCLGEHRVPALATVTLSVLVLRHQAAELVEADEDLIQRQVTERSVDSVTGADQPQIMTAQVPVNMNPEEWVVIGQISIILSSHWTVVHYTELWLVDNYLKAILMSVNESFPLLPESRVSKASLSLISLSPICD